MSPPGRWFLLAAMVLGLASCGQGDGAAPETDALRRADNAMTMGDLARARALVDGVLERDPQSFPARYRLGAFKVDDAPREALRELEAAAALDPAHPGPHGFSALACYHLSDFDGATRELRKAWTLARARSGYTLPDTSQAVGRGLDALDQERFPAAVEAFAEALAADSSQAVVWALSGVALRRGGAADRAERAARRALDLEPGLPAARTLLASMGVERGKLAEARRELEAVLAGHPALAEAHYELGLALGKDNDYRASALALWAAVLEDPTIPAYHRELGQLLLRMDIPRVGASSMQHGEWVSAFFDRQFERGAFQRTH